MNPLKDSPAIYTGRRLDFNKTKVRILQRFEFLDGKEVFFSGVRNVWIGYSYECGETSISKRPKRLNDVEFRDNPKWYAKEELVIVYLEKKKAELKLKKKSSHFFKEIIDILKPIVANLDRHEKRALINHLVNKAGE